jgi:hypothetical protein
MRKRGLSGGYGLPAYSGRPDRFAFNMSSGQQDRGMGPILSAISNVRKVCFSQVTTSTGRVQLPLVPSLLRHSLNVHIVEIVGTPHSPKSRDIRRGIVAAIVARRLREAAAERGSQLQHVSDRSQVMARRSRAHQIASQLCAHLRIVNEAVNDQRRH